MNYLHDKARRSKRIKYLIGIFGVLIVALLFTPKIVARIAPTGHTLLGRLFHFKQNVAFDADDMLLSKQKLIIKNKDLQERVATLTAQIEQDKITAAQEIKIQEELAQAPEKKFVVAGVLATPTASPYDTLVIDVGENVGIKRGMRVFAHVVIPIGYVSDVYAKTSNVILYSTPGEHTEAMLSSIELRTELIGRGGGNFEAHVPIDVPITNGEQAVVPGLAGQILAVVGDTSRNPRDPFQKVLLVSPANAQNLSWVYLEKE